MSRGTYAYWCSECDHALHEHRSNTNEYPCQVAGCDCVHTSESPEPLRLDRAEYERRHPGADCTLDRPLRKAP